MDIWLSVLKNDDKVAVCPPATFKPSCPPPTCGSVADNGDDVFLAAHDVARAFASRAKLMDGSVHDFEEVAGVLGGIGVRRHRVVKRRSMYACLATGEHLVGIRLRDVKRYGQRANHTV